MSTRRLPAEWEAQDAVQLTWPHRDSDWRDLLAAIELVYVELVERLCSAGEVLIAVPEAELERIREDFNRRQLPLDRIRLYAVPSDDTWARDHGPVTVIEGGSLRLLDFSFNGWGGKFQASLDNRLTETLYKLGAYPGAALEARAMVLEGGAIESDGRGTLLTTEACLLNPNRNATMTREDIEARLTEAFGLRKINWLTHGALAGDDTDSHIDTLARLCPDNTVLYQACDDVEDEHYAPLAAMAAELAAMTDADGRPYRLLPLPWPAPQYDPDDGHRLPATYANFLIFNDLVLVPTYGVVTDAAALAQIALAFPQHRVDGLDCQVVIRQHGSLHCITMQLPRGVLTPPGAALTVSWPGA